MNALCQSAWAYLSVPQKSTACLRFLLINSSNVLFHLLSSPECRVLQITPYEAIDFEFAAAHAQTCLVNSYMIRKALIRKHFLSTTVDHWVAKKASSPLKQHVKRSEPFELDYAEFLDDALVEAFDLGESLGRNADREASERQWWILKPSMSDRGYGQACDPR